jgi:heme exporter protein B
MSGVLAVLGRELRLAARRRSEWIQPLLFYLIVVTVFVLADDPGRGNLRFYAPAILWVGVWLAILLGAERLFRDDYEDGTLEQHLVAGGALAPLMGAKLLAQWSLVVLPMVLLSPLFAGALRLPAEAWGVLTLSLLLGTPTLSLLCGFGAALTVALPRAGVLLPLIVLPLGIPVVVFGAGAVRAVNAGLPAGGPLYFLAGLLILAVLLLPLAIAAALRNAHE